MKRIISAFITGILLTSFATAQKSWQQKASVIGNARHSAIGIAINGKGYIGLGLSASGAKLSDFNEYDPATNTWKAKTSYPGSGGYANTAFSIKGKGYVCLGSNASGTPYTDLWEYDPAADKWTKKTNFPGSARYGAMSFVINDTAFIVGGSTGGSPYLSDVYMYVPATDAWTKKSNFSGGARSHGVTFTVGKTAYVGTGLVSSTAASKDVWQYNKSSDSWSQIKDFPVSIMGSISFILNNMTYVGSGYDFSSKQKDFYIYNATANTWTKHDSVPSGFAARHVGVGFSINNNGYLGTGAASSGNLNDFWSFNEKLYKRNCINDSTFFSALAPDLDSVKWDFGDTASGSKNISKTARNAFHIYKKVGTYKVKLYSYFKGYKDTSTFLVPVKNAKPFIGNDTLYCNGFNRNLSPKKGYLKYKWSTSETTKIISIKTAGTFILTITDTLGCIAADTIIIKNPIVTAKFTPNDTAVCNNYHSFLFKSISTVKSDSLKSLTWKVSDNTSKVDSVLKKTFSTADTFFVKLVANTYANCKDSVTKIFIIHPNTSINFSINKTPQCFNGHDFILTNNSSVSKGSYTSAWDLGDGSSAGTKSISSKKYSVDSSYKISLITTTDIGCKDTLVKTVVVIPNPQSAYSTNQVTQCFNFNSYDFTNTSTIRKGSIAGYLWDFGDGKTASTNNVNAKKYTSADSFKVMLVNISDKGCRDSIIKKVYVNPNAGIGFSINKTPQCFNVHDFVFTNNSSVSKGSLTYDWNFGDGTNATNKDIASKKYTLDSTYKITLISSSDKNCKDTLVKTVVLNPSPKAGYGVNQTTQCFKWNLFDFTNSSTIRTGSIATNNWDLGDADKRGTKDIKAKHYATEDSFYVSLLTISDNGCRDSVSQWVYLLNSPKPAFTINQDTQCFNEHAYDFKNNSNIGKGSFSTQWQLGDLSTDNTTDVNQKKYAVYGSYKVLMILTSNNNCKDSLQKNIRINASPVAKFAIDKDRQCFRGNTFNFTDQSTIPQGTLTYNWSLGEGKTSTLTNVLNHQYTTEDTFNVGLITISDKNCNDTLTKMAVTFAQPVAKFAVPQDSQCWQKHFFIINNNTTIKYGTLNHIWDFGDGTKDFSHTPQTKRYANKSASYVLKYKVTSDLGCFDSAQKKVSLLERPISDFSINDSIQCFRTNNFSFVNKTTFSDLSTITYFWDYGDASKTTGKVPKSLSYPSANYYTVQLISSSYLNNCIDTLDKIMVVAPHAVPNYSINNDSQCLRTNAYNFINLSNVKFGSLTYNWNFGDNTKDTATNPAKKYTAGSNYPVKMVAITNYGCKDSISKPIVLVPHPKAGFNVMDSTLCKVQSLNITNTTSLLYGTFSQVWHFDEGADQVSLNVSGKTLNAPGFHPVRLAVQSKFGCKDTITKRVFIEQSGTTKISIAENDSQCLRGNKTQFNVFSQGGIITLSSYNWKFGDGNTSSVQNPFHTFTADSSYLISAETVSSNGCLDTAYFSMVIHPHPFSDFTANSPCFPNPVGFNNLSKIKKGSIASQSWDLTGSGSWSYTPTPIKVYNSAGTYNVKLINFSNYGCTDTVVKQVIVKAKPQALFTYMPLPSPDEIRLQLNNQSSADVTANHWDFGDGTSSQAISPIATYNDSGRFDITLIVLNNEGCSDTFKVKTDLFYPEFVFYLPNVFSPNGNDINDVYLPNGSNYNRKYTMEIYNRWGERIFETHNVNEGWDGKYFGKDCQEGVYYCYVRVLPVKGPLKTYYTEIYLLR